MYVLMFMYVHSHYIYFVNIKYYCPMLGLNYILLWPALNIGQDSYSCYKKSWSGKYYIVVLYSLVDRHNSFITSEKSVISNTT